MDPRDKVIARLKEALRFYADPGNYHAIAFLSDAPCGAFMSDFSGDHGDEAYQTRWMPGALARRTLQETASEVLAERSCDVHQTVLVVGHAEFCPECESV